MSDAQFESIVQKTQLNIKWENLNYSDKAKIFNYWSIVVIVGNFF